MAILKSARGRPRVKNPRHTVTVRMSGPEQTTLQRLANTYTGGNVARWVRFAAQHCTPTAEQCEALGSV